MAGFHPDKQFILSNLTPAEISGLCSVAAPVVLNDTGRTFPARTHHQDCGCNKKYADVGNTAPATAAPLAASGAAMAAIPAVQRTGMSIESLAAILVLSIGGLAVISMMLAHSKLHHHKD